MREEINETEKTGKMGAGLSERLSKLINVCLGRPGKEAYDIN